MGKQGRSRGQKRAAKVKSRQRRLAQDEAVREQHARLVAERAGDPRFVHRSIGPDGTKTLSWDPDTPAGRHLGEVLEGQQELFRQKFGREMHDDDPIFFDPDADTPRVMDPAAADAAFRQMFDEMIERADEIGIDPALLKASRDLGYLVTTENRHLFSAADIQAWQDTVEFYQEQDDEFDEHEPDVDDLLGVLTDELVRVVAATVRRPSAQPARVFAARVIQTDIVVGDEVGGIDDEDEGGAPGLSLAFAVLAGWLSGAREEFADRRMAGRVMAWIERGLGAECARVVGSAAGVIGDESAGKLTVQGLADELEADFLPALIWLTAGVVAEYADGDVGWLSRGEAGDGPDSLR